MDEPNRPKPRLPLRPSETGPRKEFRPRAAAPAFEARASHEPVRRTVWSKYCPLTFTAAIAMLVLAGLSKLAIGEPDAAVVFKYIFLSLGTLAGGTGFVFALIGPPRRIDSMWWLLLFGHALVPVVFVLAIVRDVTEEESSEKARVVEKAAAASQAAPSPSPSPDAATVK